MQAFAAAIRNSALQVLSLNNNPISADALDMLLDGIAPPRYHRAEGDPSSPPASEDDRTRSSWPGRGSPPPPPPSSMPTSSQHLTFEVLNAPRPRAASWSTPPVPRHPRALHALTDLHLSGCSVRLQGARSLARFVADPDRIGGLQLLALNNCDLGSRGVLLLSRALAGWCFTLEGLQVSSNHARARDTFADEVHGVGRADEDGDDAAEDRRGPLREGDVQVLLAGTLEEEREVMAGRFRVGDGSIVDLGRLRDRRRLPPAAMDEHDGPDRDLALFSGSHGLDKTAATSPRSLALSHHRLEELLEGVGASVIQTAAARVRLATSRNQDLRAAVRRNALQMLPVGRILLGARERTDEECGRDVMRDLMAVEFKGWPGALKTGAPSPSTSPSPRSGRSTAMSTSSAPPPGDPFRFMDLPRDLVPMVLAHVQPDASSALSERQTRAVLAYARDRDTLHTEREMVHRARDERRRHPSGSTPARDAYRPAFRPGPGHYGRAEWQLIASGQYGKARATVLDTGSGGGTLVDGGRSLDEVCVAEREGVNELLRRLGCDGWDAYED